MADTHLQFQASTSSLPPTPKTCFNSLPAEIREQIWLYTLTPRLILLHPHERLSPPHCDPIRDYMYDGPRITTSVRFNHTVYSPSATPAEFFKAYADFANSLGTTRSTTQENGGKLTILETAYHKAIRPLQYKSSAPPPALYVCSESRTIALKRGYVLGFQGTLLRHEDERELPSWMQYLDGDDVTFWERNYLSYKGIWINFSQDIIMLDTERKLGLYPKCAETNPLKLLLRYAPTDLNRIQRLALGGSMNDVLRKLRTETIFIHDQPVDFGLAHGMEGLQELWIDDEFEAEGKKGLYYLVRIRPLSHYNRFPDPRDALTKIEGFLGDSSGLKAPLKRVKIVRGDDWKVEYFDF